MPGLYVVGICPSKLQVSFLGIMLVVNPSLHLGQVNKSDEKK